MGRDRSGHVAPDVSDAGPVPKRRRGPTRAELEQARDLTLRDVLATNLRVLLVGINPGLYSAAIGHNFGRPGNRFWKVLAQAGFTPRVLAPEEERELPRFGLGLTNLVARATARADELSQDELSAGAQRLARLALEHAPKVVAVLGVTAYRTAFQRPKAQLGLQTERLAGAELWVLPNPSGLNAHHQLPDLTRLFAELRAFAFGDPS
jgi:TDG/mug DNA glycosylase family protein